MMFGLTSYRRYREPAENESSQAQRDAYAAGVALRMLRPSDPTLPVVVRVENGLCLQRVEDRRTELLNIQIDWYIQGCWI